MRKNTTFVFTLLLLLLALYSCENTPAAPTEDKNETITETSATTDNPTDVPPAPVLDYTLAAKRAGDFSIGGALTTTAKEKGYSLEKRSQMAEGNEEPYYIVSGEGESLLRIEPRYNLEIASYEDVIGEITVLSNRYKMANGIGVGSSIEEFQSAYADAKFWHSNVGQLFVMETAQVPVQFLLNAADFTQTEKEMTGESTPLEATDFRAGCKIFNVRVF
ncbi:MAG: hypothetical protein ACRBFS_04055 [Aureispira sp.]